MDGLWMVDGCFVSVLRIVQVEHVGFRTNPNKGDVLDHVGVIALQLPRHHQNLLAAKPSAILSHTMHQFVFSESQLPHKIVNLLF